MDWKGILDQFRREWGKKERVTQSKRLRGRKSGCREAEFVATFTRQSLSSLESIATCFATSPIHSPLALFALNDLEPVPPSASNTTRIDGVVFALCILQFTAPFDTSERIPPSPPPRAHIYTRSHPTVCVCTEQCWVYRLCIDPSTHLPAVSSCPT